jgi:hypothetical protein
LRTTVTVRYDPCFGCKAKTLQLNAGDATRDIPDKKWTAELKEYKKARDEGLRPAGTTYAHIEQARTASETLGTAYNAETMPKAKRHNQKNCGSYERDRTNLMPK